MDDGNEDFYNNKSSLFKLIIRRFAIHIYNSHTDTELLTEY